MAIKATIKPRTPCEIVLECEVDRAALEAAYEKSVKQLQRHVEMPGFRRGHAPRAMVEERYRAAIQQNTVEDLMVGVVRSVIKQYHFEPVSGVRRENDALYPERGPLKFTLEFEVAPRVTLKPYTQLPLSKRAVKVSEHDVDQIIKGLLERQATFEPVRQPRPAVYGDWLVVQYTGTVNGMEVMKRDDAWVEVSSHARVPVPGFGEQLAGVQKGETRTISVAAPADYHMKELAGKTIEFSVHVREIQERRVPELTDEIAQQILPGCKTVADLRAAVLKNHEQYREAEEQQRLRLLAREALVRLHPLPLPPSIVEARVRRLMESDVRSRLQRGATEQQVKDAIKEIEQQARAQAEHDLRAEYVLNAIAAEQKLDVTEDELSAHLASYARSFHRDVRWVRAMFEREGQMERMREVVLQEKALDFVVRNAVVTEK